MSPFKFETIGRFSRFRFEDFLELDDYMSRNYMNEKLYESKLYEPKLYELELYESKLYEILLSRLPYVADWFLSIGWVPMSKHFPLPGV